MHDTDPGFRADIEGLRGVAVLLVVLFHLREAWIPGGYVGVDIFFVISGYVITLQLTRRFERGTFNLADFYAARLRRIVPALVAMVAGASIASLFILLPQPMAQLGRITASLSVFLSDMMLQRTVSYFHDPMTVLIHSWSISVEMQFYLLYPVGLWLVRWRPAPWLALAGLISLALSALAVVYLPTAGYFLLPARGWEFAAGGLLALGGRLAPPEPRPASVMGGTGCALIVATGLLYTGKVAFPGVAALLPVGATAMILWSGRNPASVANRVLSTAILRFLGRISYSLYLWHWPIWFLWAYISPRAFGWGAALWVLAGSIAVATLSWRFIEEPFRAGRLLPGRRALFAGAALALSAQAAFGLATIATGGWEQRLPAEARADAAYSNSGFNGTAGCRVIDGGFEERARTGAYCHLGAAGAPTGWALWGDSHAAGLTWALSNALAKHGEGLLYAPLFSCPPATGLDTDWLPDGLCARHNARLLKQLVASPTVRHVVLASYYSHYFADTAFNPPDEAAFRRITAIRRIDGTAIPDAERARLLATGLQQIVATLTRAGKTVYLYDPFPSGGFDIPKRMALHRWQTHFPAPPPITRAQYRAINHRILPILDELTAEPPGRLVRLRLWGALCDGDLCPVEIGGVPLYRDNSHPSLPGARRIVDVLQPYIDRDGAPGS